MTPVTPVTLVLGLGLVPLGSIPLGFASASAVSHASRSVSSKNLPPGSPIPHPILSTPSPSIEAAAPARETRSHDRISSRSAGTTSAWSAGCVPGGGFARHAAAATHAPRHPRGASWEESASLDGSRKTSSPASSSKASSNAPHASSPEAFGHSRSASEGVSRKIAGNAYAGRPAQALQALERSDRAAARTSALGEA